jgi:hypothetical protein
LLRPFLALALATVALAPVAFAETPAPRSVVERLADAASANRQRVDRHGAAFSGPGFETLVAEADESLFFLLGEEHGIAENAQLVAALFERLQPRGYSRLMIEVSPPMAQALDEAAKGGIAGLRSLFATPGSEPAFYGMAEEAELLVRVRGAIPSGETAFWGVDYEVGADRLLIATLARKGKPAAAERALAALKAASDESWDHYETTRDPRFIYSFAGDPALVRAVREAWPRRDAEASAILATLEETFEINRLWVAGEGYASNERRCAFMRANFVERWTAEKAAGRTPKIFAKLGASHVVGGRSYTEVFDLGALIPEVAALNGGRAFRLLVLPGRGASTAVFNPSTWTYEVGEPRDSYMEGLEPIVGAAWPDAYTLIDLRPLRPLIGRREEGVHTDLMRTVHGFDAVLVMSGSTPSGNLPD